MDHKFDTKAWLDKQVKAGTWKDEFDKDGYLVVEGLLTLEEVKFYRSIYDRLLSNEFDTSMHRQDLGSHVKRKVETNENICQIMWPSLYFENLQQGKIHTRAHEIAKIVLGNDAIFDFDMLISKGKSEVNAIDNAQAPGTDTVTPMHQDESYWPDMPDKRAVTVWVALDDATTDNGCMCFVPGSHKEGKLRPFQKAKLGHHVICCDGDQSELEPAPITSGSCTLHHGRTIHYTGGNKTKRQRRAFIVNFRPKNMVEWERMHNFEHAKRGTST